MVPSSARMVGWRFTAATEAAGAASRVTAHSRRVGPASELTSRVASTNRRDARRELEDLEDGRVRAGRCTSRTAPFGSSWHCPERERGRAADLKIGVVGSRVVKRFQLDLPLTRLGDADPQGRFSLAAGKMDGALMDQFARWGYVDPRVQSLPRTAPSSGR